MDRQIEESDEYQLAEALSEIHNDINAYTQLGDIDILNVNLLAAYMIKNTTIAKQLMDELQWQLQRKELYHA